MKCAAGEASPNSPVTERLAVLLLLCAVVVVLEPAGPGEVCGLVLAEVEGGGGDGGGEGDGVGGADDGGGRDHLAVGRVRVVVVRVQGQPRRAER